MFDWRKQKCENGREKISDLGQKKEEILEAYVENAQHWKHRKYRVGKREIESQGLDQGGQEPVRGL